MSNCRRRRLLLLVILLLAYGLRLALLQNEGHLGFADEGRYKRARLVADRLFVGDFDAALERLLKYGTHHAFTAFSFVPAYIHRVAFEQAAAGELTWDEYWRDGHADFRLSAAIFALPSVLAIMMLYLISREAGAGDLEALLAAFLLAASNSVFVYSQHFLPYDSSLLVALVALWFALRQRSGPALYSLPVGMLAFLTFWTYTGYYFLVPLIALVYCGFLAPNVREGGLRILGMILGGLALFLPIYFVNLYAFDKPLIPELIRFSSTVSQGDFDAGFVLPLEFLFHAEGGIALLWLIGLCLALWQVTRVDCPRVRRRLILSVFCVVFLYLTMATMSTVLQKFVVYGRSARILAPFLALTSAVAFAPVFARFSLPARVLILAGICALALANFIPMINQAHNRVIQRYVMQRYDDLSFESSFGNNVAQYGPSLPRVKGARYELYNAAIFWPIREVAERPEGKVILEFEPIYQSPVWQYDGISAFTRQLLIDSDVKIWLIDTGGAAD